VLSTAAIGQRIEEAVAKVPHVSSAKALVKAKRKGVLVSLDLHVDPDANLAIVTDEACQAATDVLTNRVHVALVEPPHARLHYRELRLRDRQAPERRPVREMPAKEPAPVRQTTDPALGGQVTHVDAPVAVAEPPQQEVQPRNGNVHEEPKPQ
jgi:hypothetical protein